MATTKQIAEQLRKIAEHLEAAPEVELGSFLFTNRHGQSGEQFKASAHSLPRPFTKRIIKYSSFEDLILENDSSDAVKIMLTTDRSKVCKLVRPAQKAKYECEPIFSTEEEATL